MRLKDAQQSQAIAEHNAEQLARELNCAREKVIIQYNFQSFRTNELENSYTLPTYIL